MDAGIIDDDPMTGDITMLGFNNPGGQIKSKILVFLSIAIISILKVGGKLGDEMLSGISHTPRFIRAADDAAPLLKPKIYSHLDDINRPFLNGSNVIGKFPKLKNIDYALDFTSIPDLSVPDSRVGSGEIMQITSNQNEKLQLMGYRLLTPIDVQNLGKYKIDINLLPHLPTESRYFFK